MSINFYHLPSFNLDIESDEELTLQKEENMKLPGNVYMSLDTYVQIIGEHGIKLNMYTELQKDINAPMHPGRIVPY